ncbi:MAG: glycosyltransferase family 2 protein [Bacteroidota bacterium]
MSLPFDWTEVALAVLGAMHAGMALVLLVNLAYLRRTRTPHPVPDKALPAVSVLVPARNEENNLRRLLPSLAAQIYPHIEVIVVDDASDDATWDVLHEHASAFETAGHTLHPVRGDGPPAGWLGKPHALYQATRNATGEVFVFLDADTALLGSDALRRLVERFVSCETASGPDATAMSGLPLYRDRGGAALLTSLVPFSILSALPLPLVPRTRAPSVGALNGQVWAIRSEAYLQHEPHATHRDDILEDVQIGRTLKREGLWLHFVDLADCVSVRMYGTLGEAWRGFRKNAYLLAGGRPATFAPLWLLYAALFVVGPWLAFAGGVPWLLVSAVALKGGCDLARRLPLWLPVVAPLVFALANVLQLDSALSHWTGRVAWKGRSV